MQHFFTFSPFTGTCPLHQALFIFFSNVISCHCVRLRLLEKPMSSVIKVLNNMKFTLLLKKKFRTSLAVQCIRIHLPMQEDTGFIDLESCNWDPTCAATTKAHTSWSLHAATTEVCVPTTCALQKEKAPQGKAHTLQQSSHCWLQLEKACTATKIQRNPQIIINSNKLKMTIYSKDC